MTTKNEYRRTLSEIRQGDNGKMANDVVDIAILFLIGGILLPIGLNQWFSANTDQWDAQTVLVYLTVPVIGVVSLALGIIQSVRRFGGGGRR